MGTISDLSLKSLDIQRPGGIMCDHLLFNVIINFIYFGYFNQNYHKVKNISIIYEKYLCI